MNEEEVAKDPEDEANAMEKYNPAYHEPSEETYLGTVEDYDLKINDITTQEQAST